MNYLAEELKRYYKKQGAKIIFTNGKTLNQLAFQMWEYLNFHDIDASVLSRVINGKRLFTILQLNSFCKALNLPNQEETNLLSCLNKDYSQRYNLNLDTLFISKSNVIELTSKHINEARDAYYNGRSMDVIRISNLIDSLLEFLIETPLSPIHEKTVFDLLAYNLFIKTESLTSFILPREAINKTMKAANKLFELSNRFNDRLMYCYANNLLANAYYVAGGYSFLDNSYKFYRNAVKYGEEASKQLDDDDNHKLFALRTIAASATYLKDENMIMHVYDITKEILPKQPQENLVNSIHLSWTLSKGLALSNKSKPLTITELAYACFKEDLSNKGIYETSSIKMEVETLLALKTVDKAYVSKRVNQGIKIADKNDFTRHTKYFNDINSSGLY